MEPHKKVSSNLLYIVLSVIIFAIVVIHTYHSYKQFTNEQSKFALTESKILSGFMLIHRKHYQGLFIDKTIVLNKNTLKALPAFSAYDISKKFSNLNNYNIKIQTVSNRARSKRNQADKEELKAIEYFQNNRDKKEYFKYINDQDKAYYQYGYALRISNICLKCHGNRENAPKFIRNSYKDAYGYKLGDTRGIISVKIPQKHTYSYTYNRFIDNLMFNISTFFIIYIIAIYIVFKRDKYIKTIEQEAQKAQGASKIKSEFLANMSHEIRTPLNAVTGFINLLKDESVNRVKSLEYLNIIENSNKDLLMIIEDILDLSKVESGKLQIDKIDFDPKKEFEVITHLFGAKCSQKNIILSLNIDKNLPSVINSDPLRIKQVISNLISNAIKFTGDGKSIIVTIKYDDNKLFVSVKDEGIGINKDKLEHIFDAFTQEDSSTTRKYGGTGLGLTISSELVKLLGGELKVKSEVGVGSEFYFSIPVKIGKELKKENTNIKEFDFSDKKILLVEDNKANQAFMKVLLKKLNLSFDIANDGVEAVELCKQNHDTYDAILMDENMPNMNGIEATKLILKFEKENDLPHTPIIALTANALKGDRERFLKAGLDEYLTKPLDGKKLSEVLGKFLRC